MEDDNLMPNDGTYFLPREPAEQIIDRKKERAKTLEGATIIKQAIEDLDRRIKFYGSVDAMPEEVKTDPTKFLNLHNAHELTRDNLREAKEYLEGLLDNTGPVGI